MFFLNKNKIANNTRASMILAALAATTLSSHTLDASLHQLRINEDMNVIPSSVQISASATGFATGPYFYSTSYYLNNVDTMYGGIEAKFHGDYGQTPLFNSALDIFEAGGYTYITAFFDNLNPLPNGMATIEWHLENLNWGREIGHIVGIDPETSPEGHTATLMGERDIWITLDVQGVDGEARYTVKLDVEHGVPPMDVPVPEPSTYALLGAMTLFPLLKKRKQLAKQS